MDGGSAQAMLQHDIKMQVKKTGSLKRHARSLKLTRDKRRGSVASSEDTMATDGDLMTPDGSSVSGGFSEEEPPGPVGDDCRLPLRQDWHGKPPRSTWSDGSSQASSEACVDDAVSALGGAHGERYLFRYFWAHVFASQSAHLPLSVAQAGRKWLSSAVAQVRPLSDLTLALSACHCRMKTPFATVKDDLTWRYYYDRGLRGLRFIIRSFRKSQSLQGVRGALQLLACNMQLILLDLLRGLRTWSVHLRGMSELMDLVVAFPLSRESKELGHLDQNGLDFILKVFRNLIALAPCQTSGIPSF